VACLHGFADFSDFNRYFIPVSGECFVLNLIITTPVFIAWYWYVVILTCLTLTTVVLVHDTMLCELVNIWCCTLYSHRHLACYTWYVTSDTNTWLLNLIYDLWHRHSVFTPALDILYLIPDPRHLILDTGTWYMSYLSPDPNPRYMTHANPYLICFHVVQVHWPDIVTLDRTLSPLIHVLYGIFMTITFTGTWHDYYIITRHLVLLYSWTPIYLNPWNREAPDITPDTILLLIPVIG